MPFLHAFTPEPGSSVILFVIIIAETGSEEGVYTPNHSSDSATANQYPSLQQQGRGDKTVSVEAI